MRTFLYFGVRDAYSKESKTFQEVFLHGERTITRKSYL